LGNARQRARARDVQAKTTIDSSTVHKENLFRFIGIVFTSGSSRQHKFPYRPVVAAGVAPVPGMGMPL